MNTTRWNRMARLALLLVTPLGMTACGSGGAPAPAEGTVTYNGQPLAHGLVQFIPEAGGSETNPPVLEAIEQGAFHFSPAAGTGLAPGKYKVAVFPPYQDVPLKKSATPPPVVLPARYADAQTSGLSVEVPAGGNLAITFALVGEPNRPARRTPVSRRVVLRDSH